MNPVTRCRREKGRGGRGGRGEGEVSGRGKEGGGGGKRLNETVGKIMLLHRHTCTHKTHTVHVYTCKVAVMYCTCVHVKGIVH